MPSRKDRIYNWIENSLDTLEDWWNDWLGTTIVVFIIVALIAAVGGFTASIIPPSKEDWPRKHLILEEDCIRYEVENWSRTFTICGPLIMPDEQSCYVVDRDGNIALYCPGTE